MWSVICGRSFLVHEPVGKACSPELNLLSLYFLMKAKTAVLAVVKVRLFQSVSVPESWSLVSGRRTHVIHPIDCVKTAKMSNNESIARLSKT